MLINNSVMISVAWIDIYDLSNAIKGWKQVTDFYTNSTFKLYRYVNICKWTANVLIFKKLYLLKYHNRLNFFPVVFLVYFENSRIIWLCKFALHRICGVECCKVPVQYWYILVYLNGCLISASVWKSQVKINGRLLYVITPAKHV